MAIICRSYNCLYIMAPRTSCTAIGNVLCSHLGGEYLPAEDLVDAEGYFVVQKKHSKLNEIIGNGILPADQAAKLFKFTSVRNPFDSIVSLYFKKRDKYPALLSDPESWPHRVPGYVEDMKFCMTHSFNAWVLKNFSRHLIKSILGMRPANIYNDFVDGVDAVIRFENLQNDFNKVLEEIGVEQPLPIPRLNTTPGRKTDYRQYYSRMSHLLVGFVLRNELKQLGYRF